MWITLCIKGGGGWRALFARRVAATLGYGPKKVELCRGGISRLHKMPRLRRSISFTT